MSLWAPRLDAASRIGSLQHRPSVSARSAVPRRAVFASAEPQKKGKKKGDTPNSMTAYRCWSGRRLDRKGACTTAAAAAVATACPALLLRSSPPLRRPPSKEGASLRAEAEAPFRGFRLFIFGAGAVGAGLATLFGLPQLIGALGGAAGATKSVAEALQDFGINVGSFAVLAFLVQRDLQVGAAGVLPHGRALNERGAGRHCAC